MLPAPPGLNPLFHNLNIVGEITLITFVNLDQYSLSHLLSFNLCQVLFTDTLMDLIIFLFFLFEALSLRVGLLSCPVLEEGNDDLFAPSSLVLIQLLCITDVFPHG